MISTRRIPLAWAALAVAAVWAAPSRADFTPISQPDAAYVSGTSLFTFAEPDFDVVASLTHGGLTITPDIPLVALTVPTTWSSWGAPPDTEGPTPRVLWTNGFTSLTLTLSAPVSILGLEAQPNTSVISTITATFFAGLTQVGEITRDVDGNGGALLFAASTTTTPFDRVVVSSTDDFAIARIRVSAVPEPTSLVNVGAASLCILAVRWRRGARNGPKEA